MYTILKTSNTSIHDIDMGTSIPILCVEKGFPINNIHVKNCQVLITSNLL